MATYLPRELEEMIEDLPKENRDMARILISAAYKRGKKDGAVQARNEDEYDRKGWDI